MAIAGHHPETGVRLVLERPRHGNPPWRYEGEAYSPTDRYPMRATVDADGVVRVEIEGCKDTQIADKATFILRAAYRHAQGEASASHMDRAPPPRRIVRWRGEK